MEASPAPDVSVVIATRDRADQVLTAGSILVEEGLALELVIVDQSDDDRSAEALARLSHDTRVRYLRMSGRGCSSGRNLGIREARSRIVLVTDDDCDLHPGSLRKLIEAFAQDPRIGIVFGSVLAAPHDPKTSFVVSGRQEERRLVRSLWSKHRLEGLSACMGVRRGVWETLHGFDETLGVGGRLKSGGETDFALRALLAGFWILGTPAIAVTHRGSRPIGERRVTIQRYWYGTGAMFAKLIKQGHGSAAMHLLHLAFRFLLGRPSPVAASVGADSRKWLRLVSFLKGFRAGTLARLDPETGHFVPGD